jgi:hypothetical protein
MSFSHHYVIRVSFNATPFIAPNRIFVATNRIFFPLVTTRHRDQQNFCRAQWNLHGWWWRRTLQKARQKMGMFFDVWRMKSMFSSNVNIQMRVKDA